MTAIKETPNFWSRSRKEVNFNKTEVSVLTKMFTSELTKIQKENEILREHNRNLKDELRSRDEVIANFKI